MRIKFCTCGKYWHKNKWKKYTSVDDALFSCTGKKDLVKIAFPLKPGVKREFVFEKNGKKDKVLVEVTYCPECKLAGSKYFEAILQLRNTTQEVHLFLLKEVKKQKSVFITKQVFPDEHTADYFVTNQTFAKSLARRIIHTFGGTVHLNEKLFSYSNQTSKDLFRLSVLITLPSVRKGDIIQNEKGLWRVLAVEERLVVEHVVHKKHTSLPYTEKFEILPQYETRVVKNYPVVEVLHPVSFEAVQVDALGRKLKVDEKVKVVIADAVLLV